MNKSLKSAARCAILILTCLIDTAFSQDGNLHAQALYDQWIRAYSNSYPSTDDVFYVQFLSKKDADLALLKGLHDWRDPIRRVSARGLAELKTDRSFKALQEGLTNSDMFIRERSLRAVAQFKQPRCAAPLLDILKNDPEPQLREDAAYELRLYEDPLVRSALLAALKDQDRVAENAASSLCCLNEAKATNAKTGAIPHQAVDVKTLQLDRDSAASLIQAVHKDLYGIDVAKEQWAMDCRKTASDIPSWADLTNYIAGGSIPPPPVGHYVINAMERSPEFVFSLDELMKFIVDQHKRQYILQLQTVPATNH